MELMETSLLDLIDACISSSKKPAIPYAESEAVRLTTRLVVGLRACTLGEWHMAISSVQTCLSVTQTPRAAWVSRLQVLVFSRSVGMGSSVKPSIVGWWQAPEALFSMESGRPVDIGGKAANVYSFAML